MLILTRREGESIQIDLDPNTPTDLTAAELFADGPIVINFVADKSIGSIRLGIDAHRTLSIVRSELICD